MTQQDEHAFNEFAHASWPSLCRVGYLLTGDRHAAQDLAQTALIRTYLAWKRVRSDDEFRYARRVLVNAAIDRSRARARRVGEVLGLESEANPGTIPTATPIDAVDRRDEVVRLLGRLTPRERAVLALRFFIDLTETETALELGVSIGTVKSTASRALTKLRASAPADLSTHQGKGT